MTKTGKVYKIIAQEGNEIYVGSTFGTLSDRFYRHKNNYNSRDEGSGKYISSHDLFEKYGVENCKIILIKEYKVCDRKHLEVYEQLWINKLKPINKNSAFTINKLYLKQYYLENAESIKEKKKTYYEENKEVISERCKAYREDNKDKISKYGKEYREIKKDEIAEKDKKYYQANKDKIAKKEKEYREVNKEAIKEKKKVYYESVKEKKKEYYMINKQAIADKRREKITCQCGIQVRKDGLSNHLKSKTHLSKTSI